MKSTIAVILSILSLSAGQVAADWSKSASVYYGRGQEASVWWCGGDSLLFLADSSSFLYQKIYSDSEWQSFSHSTAQNPRAVLGIPGHDSLLISRFFYGLSDEGVWRCAAPDEPEASFAWVAPGETGKLQNQNVQALHAHPVSQTFLYASTGYQCTPYIGKPAGLVYSYDYGDHWNPTWTLSINPEEECDNYQVVRNDSWMEHDVLVPRDTETIWYTAVTGSSYMEGVWKTSLTCLPSNPNCPQSIDEQVAYRTRVFSAPVKGLTGRVIWDTEGHGSILAGVCAGDSMGIWRSSDLGVNWTKDSGTTYPITTMDYNFYYDGTDHYHIWAGTEGSGVLRSTDGGQNWSLSNTGLKCKNIQKVISACDLQAGLVYAVGPWAVYKSTDYGATWVEDVQGINDVPATAIASNYPQQFLIGDYDVVKRSTNGGMSWTSVSAFEGQPTSDSVGHVRATLLTAHPERANCLFAATYEPNSDTSVVGRAFVYRSLDTAVSWSRVYVPGSTQKASVTSIMVDPTRDSTVYVTYSDSTNAIVLKSTALGDSASWSAVTSGLPAGAGALSLAVSSTNGSVVYVGTTANGVYKSTNGGTSWTASGLAGHAVRDLAISRSNTSEVWAATDSGVYVSATGGSSWTLKDGSMTYKNAYSVVGDTTE